MSEPLVLGAILRVDALGWDGPPPRLPREPVRVEEGAGRGVRSFIYDLLPQHACLGIGDACLRVGSAMESLLEDWPLRDLAFPARCRLDFGLLVDAPLSAWRCDWPAAFLAVLGDAEIELGLSFYPSENAQAGSAD